MTILPRWLIPTALAAGLGIASLLPAPARASDDLVRVLVDIADVVYHSGQPYYRHGNYGRYDRVIVVRDPRGYRRYYRDVPRYMYRPGPPQRVVYRYPAVRYDRKCNPHGKCKVHYYDPRHDDRRYRDRHDRRYDGRYDVGYRYGDDDDQGHRRHRRRGD
ncbi:hypothetical protein [Marilutibacter spongiae]|uniref:Uncharacterized protein n=1 Tax=Marilutibacter spongiae TaxID=2025720 RepID=A0A7W3Y6G5_9GAMM|nr:hypothetical protein [Lysobacter spongiae]MBB1061202.1 hypothetical protein [Lysobacter spongiae]